MMGKDYFGLEGFFFHLVDYIRFGCNFGRRNILTIVMLINLLFSLDLP